MIFDISYLNDFNWWPYLEAAYRSDSTPPEKLREVLTEIRSARDEALKNH